MSEPQDGAESRAGGGAIEQPPEGSGETKSGAVATGRKMID